MTRREKIASGLELSKLFATLLRDLAIPLLVVLLIAWPSFIKGRLVEAGFRKGNIVGMEWVAVNEADEELKAARMQLNDLKAQVEVNNRALARTQTPQARELIARNSELIQATETTVRTLSQQIATNQQIVQSEAPPASASGWAVVFGGDSTADAAAHEIQRAVAANIPDPKIMLRRGSYRSVALFSDQGAARRYLDVARRQLRPDAYLVRLDSWCPERRRQNGIDVCL